MLIILLPNKGEVFEQVVKCMNDLTKLAALIKEKNAVDNEIAKIINRPAQVGHAGEYIAASIFDITLHSSATQKGSDGFFNSGNLRGYSVNVKWYPKHESLLDLNLKYFPDYYLILAGPKIPAASSRGVTRPWVIDYVFLFEAQPLFDKLRSRKVQIGVAASLASEIWSGGEIYPNQRNNLLTVTNVQRTQLSYFKG